MAYFICINQVFVQMFQFALYNLDYILRAMDKGFYTGMNLVNIQKAFDMLDHTKLLQKMECIGFKESVIKWFQAYLSNKNFL